MANKKLLLGREIDIVALTLIVLKEWKKLLLFGFIGGIFGIIVAFNIPKTYTASVILAPEMSAGGAGMADNLADMAANFGIDLGSKSQMDAIYPEIYPDIFMSSDFTHKLFTVPVRLVDDPKVRTYKEHIVKDCKVPFWNIPQLWLASKLAKPENVVKSGGKGEPDPFYISKKDAEFCESLSNNITCTIDKKTSEINISFTDQDPMVAAIMTDTLQKWLQNYITAYRTHKARIDYDYYDKMSKETEKVFMQAQHEYSNYADSHVEAILSSVSTKQQTLEQSMSSAYGTYSSMLKLRDQAEAKIQEYTPAFTVIQSSKLPYRPSSRPRIVTTLMFAILFGMAEAIWIASKVLRGK